MEFFKDFLHEWKYYTNSKKRKFLCFAKKTTARFLVVVMCITSVPVTGFGTATAQAAGTPTEREDNTIVYYADCGDYVVSTPGEGEQFGTHNSVTDQIYGEDPQTGYKWGIIDIEEELTGKNVKNPDAPDTGGIYTANTWAFEQKLTAKTDHLKTQTNRYSKNFYEKGIDPRYIQYGFELEEGAYEVTVGCSNPWGVSNSPVVKAITGDDGKTEDTILSKEDFTVPNGDCKEVTGIVGIKEGTNKLVLDIRGAGDTNKCVNVAYILVKSAGSEGETADDIKIRKDLDAIVLPEVTKTDLTLPDTGDNGSSITWKSSDSSIISDDGKVTRPEAGKDDATVTLTVTVTCGSAKPQTKDFTITVPAEGSRIPIDREDNYIVYFADCGDYVVNTVSEGDQFGTHNSVTDQAYGEDPQTGYKWGIIDTVSEPLKNGTHNRGGAFTDNTWPYESNEAGKDTEKTKSNRYTKNQFESGVQERYLDYKFELENDTYDVYVCCIDPWGVSQSPDVYLNYEKDNQILMKKGLNASLKKVVKKTIDVTDGELTVNLRAEGDKNKAINLAYILIRKYKEPTQEEKEAEAKDRVMKDMAMLNIASSNITSDITLITEGENESTITWNSSNETVLSNTGKVTRPQAGSADVPVTLTATVSYTISGYTFSQEKIFDLNVLAESDMEGLGEFKLADVEITDNYYNNVANKDVEFLNTFDPDRLLYNFRLTAGYTASEIEQMDIHNNNTGATKPYPGGWENSLIGGHTLGHYLAAVAQAVANGYGNEKGTDGITIGGRLDYLIQELKKCQDKRGTGYIFGAQLRNANNVESQFDAVEGKGGQQWVPWYTMHKIVNGLIETYKLSDNDETKATALIVAEKLGGWIYNRVSKWDNNTQKKVLGIEYGGMNDCLYEVYKYAKADNYEYAENIKAAAEKFDETALFEEILKGTPNHLNGKHANCTIPKFMGALNRYRVLGNSEEQYLKYAEAFWTLVTEKHTYITGGNSECEHFGADNILDAERSHCNCETCNTYNMLKFTRELYRITGDKKYADYYETTFINAIMASVNEKTGMTTYFQPMATGFFKVYCNPDLEKNYFWCCSGTGLENFTKLGDSFYYYKNNPDILIVNQYTSSKVTWGGGCNIKPAYRYSKYR